MTFLAPLPRSLLTLFRRAIVFLILILVVMGSLAIQLMMFLLHFDLRTSHA